MKGISNTMKPTPYRNEADVKASCHGLVTELEDLCPGTIFTVVNDEVINILAPTRAYRASLAAGVNIPTGYEPMHVLLGPLQQTPEDWFQMEINRRTGRGGALRINPDLVTRGDDGTVTDPSRPGPDSDQHAGPFFI